MDASSSMPRGWNMTAGLLAIFVCWCLCASCRKAEHPALDARIPISIDLLVDGAKLGTVTNTLPLVSLLRQGDFVPPHPCAARGEFVLRYGAGDQVHVTLRPGHADARFEFAVAGKGYSVERKRFMAILKSEGIDAERLLR